MFNLNAALTLLRCLIWGSMLLSISARAAPLEGDSARGRRIAVTVCAACHQVPGRQQRREEIGPSFVDIAKMPSTTALSLKVFLRSSSVHKKMPDFIMSDAVTNSVIAYILALKTE